MSEQPDELRPGASLAEGVQPEDVQPEDSPSEDTPPEEVEPEDVSPGEALGEDVEQDVEQGAEQDAPGDDEGDFDAVGAVFWAEVWPFKDDSDGSTIPFGQVRPADKGRPESAPAPVAPVFDLPLEPPTPRVSQPSRFPDWDPGAARRRRTLFLVAATVALLTTGVLGWAWLNGGGDDVDQVAPASDHPFAVPVDLKPGTAYVRTRVLASGDLVVTHWIRTRALVGSVTVRAPRTLMLDPDSVSVTHVVLAANDASYPENPTSQIGTRAWTFNFPEARTIYLRYRLSGVVDAGGPGGRALARITSLYVVPGSRPVPVTQVVVGAKVLALACTSGPPHTPAVPCGSTPGGTWTVRPQGARTAQAARQPTRVMAQVDLSRRG